MLLLLELHLLSGLTTLTVLLEPLSVLLPSFALLILLMETQRTQPVSRLLAEHRKDGALSSWHMGRGYGFLGLVQEKDVKLPKAPTQRTQ